LNDAIILPAATAEPVSLQNLHHDALSTIASVLCDPLRHESLNALSRTCRDVRVCSTPSLAQLRQRYEKAKALCEHVGESMGLDVETELWWGATGLGTTPHIWTLGMLLQSRSLTLLETLVLYKNELGDEGMLALLGGLDGCALPCLHTLNLCKNNVGVPGAATIARALRRGALPSLKKLDLGGNKLGDKGLGVLAPPLRVHLHIARLHVGDNGIGDRGLAALLSAPTNYGILPVLPSLLQLWLSDNELSDAGCATLASALCAGAMPRLQRIYLKGNVCTTSEGIEAVPLGRHEHAQRFV